MTISAADAEILRQAGFLESEIAEFANAKTTKGLDQPMININSPVWQSVIRSRREWWIDKIEEGWTEQEIINELMNYYRRDLKRNPYDFIRAEYKPPKKVDYMDIARERAANKIKGEIEGYKV